MFTDRLTEHLGLINWQLKVAPQQPIAEETIEADIPEPESPAKETVVEPPQLNKSEFRLLVNMLKAINHDCQYENLSYQGDYWVYQLGETQLVFNQIEQPDDPKQLHLCTLKELISNPENKRPVWEKLKTLKN